MTSRKLIKSTCSKFGFKIQEMHYIREFVPVPEELVPVGWHIIMDISGDDNFEDIVEMYGGIDDIISQITDYAQMTQFQ